MTHYITFNFLQSPLFLLNLQNSYGADPSVLAITILNMAHIHCIVIIVLASLLGRIILNDFSIPRKTFCQNIINPFIDCVP